MSRHEHENSLCGPDCTYRRLYEGSQASLSDMSSKQAGALNRVARLRTAIVAALKQNFPVEFGAAERALSARMFTTDDEVLLAYLNGFLALPTRRAAAVVTDPVGAADLRDELAALGIDVPAGNDLSGWAKAVAHWSDQRSPVAAGVDVAGPALAQPVAAQPVMPEPAAAVPVTVEAAVPVSEPASPATAQRSASRRGGRSLRGAGHGAAAVSAFDDMGVSAAAPDEDVPWGSDPGSDPLDDYDPAPILDRPDFDSLPAPEPAPVVLSAETLTSLFDEDTPPTLDLASVLFFDDEPDVAAETPAATPAAPGPAGPAAPAQTDHAVPAAGADVVTPAGEQAAPVNTAPASAAEPAPPNAKQLPQAPLRPTLFAQSQVPKSARSKRPPRVSRVIAAPPDPRGLDVPVPQDVTIDGLTQELFDKLVASVCIPRPVFTSDLAAQIGSPELVEEWERKCRSMGTDSPVRFVSPKRRHQARGCLVVPAAADLRTAASEFSRSLWSELIERRMLGAKLYEVGVLLHRFADKVVSSRYDYDHDIITLLVNQPRGMVGVVVALDPESAAAAGGRKSLADAVESLLKDRLTLIAVLTHLVAGDMLDKLAVTIREEASARGWQPAMPILTSQTWEFAADGGATATAVL